MTPLFILTLNNQSFSSDKIQKLVNKVNEDNSNYAYYFGKNIFNQHHWGVKADIKRFIQQKILDQQFLFDTLGFPNDVKNSLFDGNPVKCFVYNEVGVRIYFSEGFAIGFDEIDKKNLKKRSANSIAVNIFLNQCNQIVIIIVFIIINL